jgi:diacylglycerol O-acyltransferase / wax synthase
MTKADDSPVLAEWSSAREFSPADSLMWRISSDPRLSGTILAVEMLDTVPEWDRFLAAHEWGSRVIGRARQRVIEPALNAGPPVWAVVDDFDITKHVRPVTLETPGTFRQLLDMAAEIYQQPFDKSRPPWEAVLVDGLECGGAAYILKMHHAATDGTGFVQLLSRLHSTTRHPLRDKQTPPPADPESIGGVGLVVNRAVGAPFEAARHSVAAMSRLSKAVASPRRTPQDVTEYALSLNRILRNGGSPSPLLSGRSPVRRFEAFSVPFDEFRAAAKASGGSVNDAFLTAVAGGVARYHRRFGMNVDVIPIGVPVNIRNSDDAPGGNRFAAIRVPVPGREMDVRERIRQINEYVTKARREPAINALGVLTAALSPMPSALTRQLSLAIGRQLDIQASNVVGLREPVFLAGAKVTHLYGFAPCPGTGAMIVLGSHGDVFCVAVNLDVAAIAEPAEFIRCLQDGFDEMLAVSAS